MSAGGVRIAVVGLAARLPGAPTLAAFRALVRSGRSGIRRFTRADLAAAGIPAERMADPRFVPAKGFLDEADRFDAAFFGMTPLLARALDPQHRLFLQAAWHALEDAGLTREPPGRRIGVFAGASSISSYYHAHAARDPETAWAVDPFQLHIVNQPAALANQVSYALDLTGPSLTVSTACSTGLATLVAACQSLADVQCDAALAGAVTVSLPLVDGYVAPEGSILSPSGACRPFDAAADGTVAGDGVAAIVLKRLDDALAEGDRVHATIRGYGIANDGARKVGFSAPSAAGQARAIADALAMAEIEPHDIGFIETHGTGTRLGDAIEIAALRTAFSGCAAGSIALGAVKAQIGHLDAAAGMAGFLKAVIAVEEGLIPPVHGAERPNPELELAASPFRIPASAEPWPAGPAPRRAGISSFGMGGTNVHVVIEAEPAPVPVASASGVVVLALSAPTADGLRAAARDLADGLADPGGPALADAGTSLARRTRAFPHRLALVATSPDRAVRRLRGAIRPHPGAAPHPVFAFTGQGSQRPGLARALHAASPRFAAALDACRADLAGLGCDIDPFLFGDPDDAGLVARLGETEVAQPTLFSFGYAAAAMLEAWGLTPSAALGHSLGEVVALTVSGTLARGDALAFVVARGRAMQRLAEGAMLAVAAPAGSVEAHLGDGCAIAAWNGPDQTVVAGPPEGIQRLGDRLAAASLRAHRLPSRRAFHSAMMEPVLDHLARAAARMGRHPSRIPVISNVTGAAFTGGMPEPGYLARHAREPVRFGPGVTALVASGARSFIEIGAGNALQGLIRANAGDAEVAAVALMPRPRDGDAVEQALDAVASLWNAGAELDWRRVDAVARGRPVSLPPYAFARERCWVGAPVPPQEHPSPVPTGPDPAACETEAHVGAVWAACLGRAAVGADEDYHRLGGDSLTAVRIAEILTRRLGVEVRTADLIQAPTPRRLAALLSGRRGDEAGDLVITARAGTGPADELVLFHPIGGTVHLYADLVAALPEDRTIRLVQAPAIAGRTDRPGTVEAMAGVYLDALALDPRRPVHFGGASFGGLVAFEAARQWRAQGGHPASVILLDTPAPGAVTARIDDEADALAFVAGLIGRELEPEVLRRLDPEARLARFAEVAAGHLPPGLGAASLRRHVEILRDNARAMNAYRPERSGAAPVTLVAARLRDPGQPAAPETGWPDVLRGRLAVETVAGGHLSMLAPPHVRATALAVEAGIARGGVSLAAVAS